MALVPRTEREAPEAPESLPAPLKAEWRNLWDSPLAAAWSPETDAHALARLFSLYELRAEALERVKEDGMMVDGSQGQPVDHPATRRMSDWDSEIRQLEDRFGLSPKSRLALGVEGLRVQQGIEGLSRVDDGGGNLEDIRDPRLELTDEEE